MTNKEKEAIEEVKRIIKNSNFCDSIGTGQIETLLNCIDKLQKENERYIRIFNETEKIMNKQERTIYKLQKENEELKRKTYKTYIDDKGELKFVFDNYISKDKIREYCKKELAFKNRLEREKQEISEYNKGRFDTYLNIIEELLGE